MTPNSGQHLQIFNPVHDRTLHSFPQFSRLPPELRLAIWEQALCHERHLRVKLYVAEFDNDPLSRGKSDCMQGISGRYHIVWSGTQLISKLFRTASESRNAALGFHRVHLPCQYKWGEKRMDGTFYFNPELDTLEIKGGRCFLDFAHDLWANDQRKVGLINVAFKIVSRPSSLPIPCQSRSAAREALARLKRVIFVSRLCSQRRMWHGPLNGVPAIRNCQYHRSRPVMGTNPQFDRLSQDPRPIGPDLKRVYLGSPDPRKTICHWHRLLDEFGVQYGHKVDYRFVITHKRYTDASKGHLKRVHRSRIPSREEAFKFVQQEEERWHDGLRRKQARGYGKRALAETDEELERVPQLAVGFWSFPIEAVGPLPDPSGNNASVPGFWKCHRIVDLTNYHPELCLTRLNAVTKITEMEEKRGAYEDREWTRLVKGAG